jgi:hypothetical protein
MIIPVAVIAFFLIKGNGCLAWWEGLLMFFAPLLLIFIFKATSESFQVSDTEWWGNYAISAVHTDDWDERVSCRHEISCSHTCSSGSGKDKRTYKCHSNDGYYHAYDVDYHPDRWDMQISDGSEFGISQAFYNELVNRWGSNVYFIEKNRRFHSIDGDARGINYDGVFEHAEPVFTQHYYENRVAASDSILSYRNFEPEELKKLNLYDYPKMNGWRHPAILGWNDPEADRTLQNINGLLGKSKQVKVFVLVWKNRDKGVVEEQKRYWKGGNKNEFVVNIGVDDAGVIKWGDVFCWTSADNPSTELLRIETRNHINDLRDQPLNLTSFAQWLQPQLQEKWVRQSFKKFSYITVDPPTWAIVLTFIFTAALCGGLGWWCWTNEFTHGQCSTDNPFGQGRNGFFNSSGRDIYETMRRHR